MAETNKLDEQAHESKRLRGIYLLPNLFTTGGLFAGFYAVVAAMKGMFDIAAIAIFIAMIADSLDGRVARLTNTTSPFGAEYDSLSDMVAFGIAPSLVVYRWSLIHLGKLGWLVAFCFTAGAALRLARFNVQEGISKRYFQGLPSPAAAGVVASMVWASHELILSGQWVVIATALITLAAAILMVSNIRFYSFKELDFKGKVPFRVLLLVVLMFVLVSINPPIVLFVCFMSFAFSGPILRCDRLFRYLRTLRSRNHHES